jgi:hypothetical protein
VPSILITNNPRMSHILSSERMGAPLTRFDLQNPQTFYSACTTRSDHACFMRNSTALTVLVTARDLIHSGWRILNHPLYGNYRPHQQPFRSILLHHDRFKNNVDTILDVMSLQFIESAIKVYQDDRVLEPVTVPDSILTCCSILDFELMRVPFEQSGWLMVDNYKLSSESKICQNAGFGGVYES